MKLIQLKTGEWISPESIYLIRVDRIPMSTEMKAQVVIRHGSAGDRTDYAYIPCNSEELARATADDLARQVNGQPAELQGIAGMSDEQLKEALKELRQHARINETDLP